MKFKHLRWLLVSNKISYVICRYTRNTLEQILYVIFCKRTLYSSERPNRYILTITAAITAGPQFALEKSLKTIINIFDCVYLSILTDFFGRSWLNFTVAQNFIRYPN